MASRASLDGRGGALAMPRTSRSWEALHEGGTFRRTSGPAPATDSRSWTRPGLTSHAKRPPWDAPGPSKGSPSDTASSSRAQRLVARGQLSAYVERPLGRTRDDGLWREYQEALGAARARRQELREALSSRIDAARAAHRRRFELRHHVIASMPVSGADKRKLYKLLSFERKAAERKLGVKIEGWRKAGVEPGPGSWKEFLGARAARGDQRALRCKRTGHPERRQKPARPPPSQRANKSRQHRAQPTWRCTAS